MPACFLLSGVGCWRDPARPGRPLPSRCAGAGDDPEGPGRPFFRGVLALGMIRHSAPLPLPPRRGWRCADPGASHPSAAAAAGGDPGAFVAPFFSRPWRTWWVGLIRARPWRPFRHGGGRWGTEGKGHARLWWYSILSTRYIGMWFYRPVTTIGRVIRPDFCVNANLQNFFRVNDNLQNFFMGDLCVNANQH